MSELKAIKIELNNHGKPIASIQGSTSYYGISPNDTFYSQEEADKVINELEADKLELRQRVNVLEGRLFGLSQSHNVETYTCGILERKIIRLERKIEISDKQLRHSNRNRCLAMARMCESEAQKCLTQQGALIGFSETDRFQYLQGHFMHFSRWHRRWLALAKEPTWAKFLQLIHKEAK